ncbi:MAG: hypothetical protein GY719_35705 [bacterium]|nr:hypothetical protein [bacterium]
MRKRGPKKLCHLALSLLLFLPAVPTLAENESFELHLEEALAWQGAGLLDETMDAWTESAPEPNLTEINLESLPETFTRMAEEAKEADMAEEAKPKGRWIKRHWYVPVLAVIVVGFAIAIENNPYS